VETVWHELLRAVVQDWTDMNGMPNTVNRVFGSISANFSRSTSPVDRISEGVYSQQGLYISYTSLPHALHSRKQLVRSTTGNGRVHRRS
jgi:hypothetical protein